MIRQIRLQIVIFLILVGGILGVTSWMAFAAYQGKQGALELGRKDIHSSTENKDYTEKIISVSSSSIFSLTKSLAAPAGDTGDRFGDSIYASGSRVIVGAWLHDVSVFTDTGAAYLYEYDGQNWGFVKKLTAWNWKGGDFFGKSVAISGDKAIVGAFGAEGIRVDTGAAYLFDRDSGGSGNWGLFKTLKASDGAPFDNFGFAVTFDNDTIAVGAPGKAKNLDDDVGAVYVYQRNLGGINNWGEVLKMIPSDGQNGDRFGQSVSLDGDTLLVGASDKAGGAGAAYLYQRDHGGMNNWGQVTKLTAFDGESFENFGTSVAVKDNFAAVGAENGDGAADESGAVYLFGRNQGGTNKWGLIKKITASDGTAGDLFGESLSLGGDQLVVGAFLAAGNEIGSGVVYVFKMDWGGPGNWGELTKIIHPDGKMGDGFGSAVNMQQDLIAIGANGFDAVNIDSGAAFIFEQTIADLEIVKQVTKSTAAPGDTLTYTLSYANSGPKPATNVIITDTLPVSQTLISWESVPTIPQNQFTQSGQILSWQVSSLPVDDFGTITLTVSTDPNMPGGIYLNTVQISGTPGDIFPVNNNSKSGVLIANSIFSVYLPVILR